MMWFLPGRVGDYELYCAEYCGLQHSYMKANVRVLSKKDYTAWYADTSAVKTVATGSSPAAEGLKIMLNQGCNACHSTDGTKIVGPSYLNLYGKKEVVIRDGKEVTVTVDDEYIKRSIYDPNYDVVRGFPRNLMQSYKETIKDDDLKKIIAYLKSLNEK
jgi:cytochrome c oxidase subunit 2